MLLQVMPGSNISSEIIKKIEFMDQLYNIKKLIEKIENELESARNKEICEKWNSPEVQYTYMHPVPKRKDQIPIVADLECPLWARVLNFNVKEFYTNPLIYLEKQLEMSLYRYNIFKDDSGLGRTIAIWLGVNFEASILGCKSFYPNDFDPVIDRSFMIIKNERSLNELEDKKIDFRNSGILNLAHEFFCRIREVLPPDWNLIFPDWVIGPFGIGSYLRGYQNILADSIVAPRFFMRILDVVSNKMIEFSRERANFLGVKVERFNLHNDDVNDLNFSRGAYKKLVFPIENKLSNFYGGFQYWHSCGNVESFIDDLLEFKDLVMLDCSGWNDLDVFIEAFSKKGIHNIGIEKRFNPCKEVINADDEYVRKRIREIYESAGGIEKLNINFKIDGIGDMGDNMNILRSINNFISISREMNF